MDALLAEPQARPPGGVFCYDNGAEHLLAAGMHAAVGDLVGYTGKRVFGPAGITDVWGLGALLTEATTAHSDGRDPEWLPYGWLFWWCRRPS